MYGGGIYAVRSNNGDWDGEHRGGAQAAYISEENAGVINENRSRPGRTRAGRISKFLAGVRQHFRDGDDEDEHGGGVQVACRSEEGAGVTNAIRSRPGRTRAGIIFIVHAEAHQQI